MKAETLVEAKDERGRRLFVVRRAPNGDVVTIVHRYGDMTGADKDVVRAAFAAAIDGAVGGESDGKVGDVERFLAFDEDRPCG